MSDVRFKLTYAGSKASYTFNKVKPTATDAQIYGTALAFARLRDGSHENIYKVVETEIQGAQEA